MDDLFKQNKNMQFRLQIRWKLKDSSAFYNFLIYSTIGVGVYATGNSFFHQKMGAGPGSTSVGGQLLTGVGNWQRRNPPPFQFGQRPKIHKTPKPSQLHYCEVCKISCAGAQVDLIYNLYLFVTFEKTSKIESIFKLSSHRASNHHASNHHASNHHASKPSCFKSACFKSSCFRSSCFNS